MFCSFSQAELQLCHVSLLGVRSDADDPYRYIQVQCHVAEITKEGAKEHIDKLSIKYEGRPFDHRKGEVRDLQERARTSWTCTVK
jgi:hypothetical protein